MELQTNEAIAFHGVHGVCKLKLANGTLHCRCYLICASEHHSVWFGLLHTRRRGRILSHRRALRKL